MSSSSTTTTTILDLDSFFKKEELKYMSKSPPPTTTTVPSLSTSSISSSVSTSSSKCESMLLQIENDTKQVIDSKDKINTIRDQIVLGECRMCKTLVNSVNDICEECDCCEKCVESADYIRSNGSKSIVGKLKGPPLLPCSGCTFTYCYHKGCAFECAAPRCIKRWCTNCYIRDYIDKQIIDCSGCGRVCCRLCSVEETRKEDLPKLFYLVLTPVFVPTGRRFCSIECMKKGKKSA